MNEPHESDERLSEYVDVSRDDELDGSAASESRRWAALESHVSGCELCRERLAALRSVSLLVATPVAPVSPAHRSSAVASAIREGLAKTEELDSVPLRPRERQTRWFRSAPILLTGAAAAAVLLAIALPLALLGQSSPSSKSNSAARAATHGAASTLGRPAPGSATASPSSGEFSTGSSAANSTSAAAPSPQSAAATLPDLGKVSSIDQVLTRVSRNATATSSQNDYLGTGTEGNSNYTSCVEATRRAARGGPYGPGLVATATYQGRAAIVTEFWPTMSPPSTGKEVVAVSSTSGCKLLAHTST